MDVNPENNSAVQGALLVKLAYERHETYISAARAIINLSMDGKNGDCPIFDSLAHILNLMAEEVGALNHMLEKQIADALEPAAAAS